MKTDTIDHTATILTLIRRGETVSHIAATLGVKCSEVEAVMDRYVEKMMRV